MSGLVVTTSTSTYVLNTDEGTCTRFPDTVEREPSEYDDVMLLRNDCRPIPMPWFRPPVVGESMVLLLMIEPPTVTQRTTTPVTKIEVLP